MTTARDVMTVDERAAADAGVAVPFGMGVEGTLDECRPLLEFNAHMTLRKVAKGGATWRSLRLAEGDGAAFWVGFLLPEDVA